MNKEACVLIVDLLFMSLDGPARGGERRLEWAGVRWAEARAEWLDKSEELALPAEDP